jgi:hypothetical protein
MMGLVMIPTELSHQLSESIETLQGSVKCFTLTDCFRDLKIITISPQWTSSQIIAEGFSVEI